MPVLVLSRFETRNLKGSIAGRSNLLVYYRQMMGWGRVLTAVRSYIETL